MGSLWSVGHPLDPSHQSTEVEGVGDGIWESMLQVQVPYHRQVHLN